MSIESGSPTAEKIAALLAFAVNARSRADERAHVAQMLGDRAVTARRLTEQATARALELRKRQSAPQGLTR